MSLSPNCGARLNSSNFLFISVKLYLTKGSKCTQTLGLVRAWKACKLTVNLSFFHVEESAVYWGLLIINPFHDYHSVEEQGGSVLHQRQADHRHSTTLWHRRNHLPLSPTHQWTRDPGSTWTHQHDPDRHGNAEMLGGLFKQYICALLVLVQKPQNLDSCIVFAKCNFRCKCYFKLKYVNFFISTYSCPGLICWENNE